MEESVKEPKQDKLEVAVGVPKKVRTCGPSENGTEVLKLPVTLSVLPGDNAIGTGNVNTNVFPKLLVEKALNDPGATGVTTGVAKSVAKAKIRVLVAERG